MTNKLYKKYTFPANYSLTKACLDIFLGIGESIGVNNKKAWRKALGAPDLPNWRLNRAFRYLESRGEIERVKKYESEFFHLTRKGRLKGLLNRMKEAPARLPRWDGKWRIIIWDIPEENRIARDYLRKWIKNMGFVKLQYSVFIRPYSIAPAAVKYINESGLSKYIRFIRVDKIDDDEDLKRRFNLN